MTTELARSQDTNTQPLPITAICIVADKNKCPKGFSPVSCPLFKFLCLIFTRICELFPLFQIVKTSDDNADADLWKESSFSIFSRPVRYLAISRDIPETVIKVTALLFWEYRLFRDCRCR